MMDRDSITRRLTDVTFPPQGVGRDEAEVVAMLDRYPFYTLPAALLLREKGDSLDSETARRLTTAVALSASDPSSLYMLLERDSEDHIGFYPDDKPSAMTTENAIDSFLNTYGSTSPEEEAMLNRLIFNPTPDYAQLLAREEESNLPTEGEAPAGTADDLINAFIIKQKQNAGVIDDPAAASTIDPSQRRDDAQPRPAADNSLLSESLAKIFIKQRHYQRAYEIISQLSLNYPEKSIYFADQLRFLRKLINYQNHKEQSSK